MSFTAEQIAGRMGLSPAQISSDNMGTINGFIDKYGDKVFTLNLLDSKWKTFAFRNKLKNMANVNEGLMSKFLIHIDDQCKKLHVNMIISEDIKTEASEGIPTAVKREIKTESMDDAIDSVDQERKKRKLDGVGASMVDSDNFGDDSGVNESMNETIYKTPETSRILNSNFTASNSKSKLQFKEAFDESVYSFGSESTKTDKPVKQLNFDTKFLETKTENFFNIITPANESFKVMRESSVKIAKTLDEELEIKKEQFDFAISDPTVQSQSSIYTVGRIVIDTVDELDPVFEPKNLALETSQNVGIGKRIKIDVSNLPKGTDLFLGQILVCKGKNVTGEEFIIEELINANEKNRGEREYCKETTIVSVNGPYCNEKNLNYSIFESFIKEKINKDLKPDFLILNGPLIDISNQCFITGIMPPFEKNGTYLQIDTIDDIFCQIIFPILKEINSDIQVFIVPHATEAISKYSTYPHPSYLTKLQRILNFTIPENLHFVSNPSILNLNGFNVGINNIDIFKNFKNLSIDNLFMNRFKNITNLMLQHNSFYPCYPTIPSLNDKNISTRISRDLFNKENELDDEEKDPLQEQNYENLVVTRNRMNKNISVNDVAAHCAVPPHVDLDFVIHNSNYVPHLEQLACKCVSINSNAFHQGSKLGFYSVVKAKIRDQNECSVTAEIRSV